MMKQALREKMIKLRNSQTEHDKQIKNQSIITQIRNHDHFLKAKTVALFYPMMGEIDLLDLLTENKIFLFPRVCKNEMDFYMYHKQMTWEKSKFGVREPARSEQIFHDKIDFMIVPALAISKDRSRVGYGKGFYDQYIQKHDIKYAIGVIYDFQEVETIETTSFDQRLDEYIKGSL